MSLDAILRDPAWIGVLITIISIIVAIVIYRRQTQRKSLSAFVEIFSPLLTISKDVSNQIEITFEGKPVKNIFLIQIRVANSGNVPIRPEDFTSPITFHFGENAQLLTSEITETKPKNIEAALDSDNKSATMSPVLLNQGESITGKFLVSEAKEPSVSARIIGISEIKSQSNSRKTGESSLVYFRILWTILLINWMLNNTFLLRSFENYWKMAITITFDIILLVLLPIVEIISWISGKIFQWLRSTK